MIDEKKLSLLRDVERDTYGRLQCNGVVESILPELLDTIEALWKVTRGAELLSSRWHDGLPHRVYIEALDKILAALHTQKSAR